MPPVWDSTPKRWKEAQRLQYRRRGRENRLRRQPSLPIARNGSRHLALASPENLPAARVLKFSLPNPQAIRWEVFPIAPTDNRADGGGGRQPARQHSQSNTSSGFPGLRIHRKTGQPRLLRTSAGGESLRRSAEVCDRRDLGQLASQDLQLCEGIAKIRLRCDLRAIPGSFEARRQQGKGVPPRRECLGHQQLRLGKGLKIFARSFCAIGRKRPCILKARDPRPVGAMHGHAVVAPTGGFSRGENPFLPGPRGNCRGTQGHFLRSGRAKPVAKYPVGDQDGARANANPQQDIAERFLAADIAQDAFQRVEQNFGDALTNLLPPRLLPDTG